MDLKELAKKIIPDTDLIDPDKYEDLYPARSLPKGAEVTRLAPSPTGFIHLGNLYSALADERAAHVSGGIFYLRIEDTDAKRKVDGAVESVINSLRYFGLKFDEGAETQSRSNFYGPYYQRQRVKIYRAFARKLIEQGRAYPCFCTEEDLKEIRALQTERKETPGYYGEYARCRNLTPEEVCANIDAGKPYVIRLKSMGDSSVKHTFKDVIKGEITVPENSQDIVILKSDGIPTYHFAHAIDDHFMRTTLVIRGEEWLSSLPIHLELFSVLGWKPPKYAHTSSLMKMDGESKRKLSKRKDPELSLEYYRSEGYLPVAVMKYLMTILNSGFEEWYRKNPDADWRDYNFKVEKMGKSGILFDLDKLKDISRDEISRMDPEDVYKFLAEWAKAYGTDADKAHMQDKDYILQILNLIMGTSSKKRRKDIETALQFTQLTSYFFDDTYNPELHYAFPDEAVNTVIRTFAGLYDINDDNSAWFAKVKVAAKAAGFASEASEYKASPESFIGSVSDAAGILRTAITGSPNSPDLCTIMKILGTERSQTRLRAGLRG